jgi:hypothetical protein
LSGLVDGASVDVPVAVAGFARAACEKDPRQDRKTADGTFNETLKA